MNRGSLRDVGFLAATVRLLARGLVAENEETDDLELCGARGDVHGQRRQQGEMWFHAFKLFEFISKSYIYSSYDE